MRSDATGLLLDGSGGIAVDNASATGGTTGIELTQSTSNIFQGVNTSSNVYGVSLSNSLANNFYSGISLNNSRFDVYTTNDSASSGDNLMDKYNCGVSDAAWATCASYVKANFSATPITGCTTIMRPGSYEMQNNLLTVPSDCMDIRADNVLFNCNGENISSSVNVQGPAILASGVKNVTIENCNVGSFDTALEVQDSSQVTVRNSTTNHTASYGLVVTNVTGANITDNLVSASNKASMFLNNVRGSEIENNKVTRSTASGATGMLIINSSNNKIEGNNGNVNYYGMELEGNSINNTVVSNIFGTDVSTDYVCTGEAQGLASQNGGANTGATKSDCAWLAAIPSGSAPISCLDPTGATRQTFGNDYVYPFNSTCYLMGSEASLSTIDCNGHTVLSPNGGSFVTVEGGGNITIKNCVLKGFTQPVIIENGYGVTLINTTVLVNATLTNATSGAVSIYKSQRTVMEKDNITTPYVGLYANGSDNSTVTNTTVSALGTAYALYNTNDSVFTQDTARPTSGIGALVSNSLGNQFTSDGFYGATNGLWCLFTSQKAGSNTDNGGNYCSLNTQCGWIGGSAATCH
jgi:hypothetical protein